MLLEFSYLRDGTWYTYSAEFSDPTIALVYMHNAVGKWTPISTMTALSYKPDEREVVLFNAKGDEIARGMIRKTE